MSQWKSFIKRNDLQYILNVIRLFYSCPTSSLFSKFLCLRRLDVKKKICVLTTDMGPISFYKNNSTVLLRAAPGRLHYITMREMLIT